MIIEGREHAFKALIKTGNGWKLSHEYFFNQKEVMHFCEGLEVIWPVSMIEGDIIEVPSEGDLG